MRGWWRLYLLIASTFFGACAFNADESRPLQRNNLSVSENNTAAPVVSLEQAGSVPRTQATNLEQSGAISVTSVAARDKRLPGTEGHRTSQSPNDGTSETYRRVYRDAPNDLNGKTSDQLASDANKQAARKALQNRILQALASRPGLFDSNTSVSKEDPSGQEEGATPVTDQENKTGAAGLPQVDNAEADDSALIDQVDDATPSCKCAPGSRELCVDGSNDDSTCVEQAAADSSAGEDDPEEIERLRRMSESGNENDANLALGLAGSIPPESWSANEFSLVLDSLIGEAASQLGPNQENQLRSALEARSDDLLQVFTNISYRERVESFKIDGFDVDVTYGCIVLADLKVLVRVPFSGASNLCEIL